MQVQVALDAAHAPEEGRELAVAVLLVHERRVGVRRDHRLVLLAHPGRDLHVLLEGDNGPVDLVAGQVQPLQLSEREPPLEIVERVAVRCRRLLIDDRAAL